MVDKKYYVENEELKKHGISIIYTKKSYGNVMKMEKEKFVLDFDFQDKVIIGCHQTHSDNIAVIEDLDPPQETRPTGPAPREQFTGAAVSHN